MCVCACVRVCVCVCIYNAALSKIGTPGQRGVDVHIFLGKVNHRSIGGLIH